MQGGKSTSVVESAKEAAANVGASTWAGKEKSKAVVQETLAKARAHDPAEKAAADERMQGRVGEAEAAKQDAMRHHAAAVHQPSLPEPPARTVPNARDTEALPGARLVVGGNGAPSGRVTDAAPNDTETAAGYPTPATGGHP